MIIAQIVQVTQDDISLGIKRNGWQCPIHLALWRATHQRWDVHATTAKAIEPPPRREVRLPTEVVRFNHDFDLGLPVRPFSFQFVLQEITANAQV